jgi:hypothetical protein
VRFGERERSEKWSEGIVRIQKMVWTEILRGKNERNCEEPRYLAVRGVSEFDPSEMEKSEKTLIFIWSVTLSQISNRNVAEWWWFWWERAFWKSFGIINFSKFDFPSKIHCPLFECLFNFFYLCGQSRMWGVTCCSSGRFSASENLRILPLGRMVGRLLNGRRRN